MGTTLGLVHLELHVMQAMNLKEKRRVIKSFKDHLANRFNVSVAEVGGLDSHRSTVLAVAMVGNSKRHMEGALQRIVNRAQRHRDMVLVASEVEWL